MTKPKRTSLAILLATLLIGLAWESCSRYPRQPTRNGRALSEWLTQLDSTYPDGMDSTKTWQAQMSPKQAEAATAIREIGTNALPHLVHSLTNVNSRRMERIISGFRRLVGTERSRRPPGAEQRKAAFGLAALGPVAAKAIPELSEAMGDPFLSAQAAVALASIGPEGWAALTCQISSTNSFAAHNAIRQLANYHAVVAGTVEALMAKVRHDPSGSIYVSSLVRLGPHDQRMVPFLTSLLESSNAFFCIEAAHGLQVLGTNSKSAVPELSKLLCDRDPAVRRAATNSLKQIDSDAASKAGVR